MEPDLVTVTFGTGIDLDTGGTILIVEEVFKEDTTLVAVVRETCS